jgi:hypothetical protein
MFISMAPRTQFQVAKVGKLWRGNRSSLSGLELVFGCAAIPCYHFLQKYWSPSIKIACIPEIRHNARYVTKGTGSVSLLAAERLHLVVIDCSKWRTSLAWLPMQERSDNSLRKFVEYFPKIQDRLSHIAVRSRKPSFFLFTKKKE